MSDLTLPAWADELRTRYLAGEASLFLVHGNVRDLVPWTVNGRTEWVDTRTFLERFLARTREVVLTYDISQGTTFPSRAHQRRFQTVTDAARALKGEPKMDFLPRTPGEAIPEIEKLITNPSVPSGVIIDFFEMIAPRGDVSFMTTQDRANLVSLQRWSSDPAFLMTDNLVILVSEHLSDIERRVLASPQLSTVLVPFPEQSTRQAFLEDEDTAVQMEMDLREPCQGHRGPVADADPQPAARRPPDRRDHHLPHRVPAQEGDHRAGVQRPRRVRRSRRTTSPTWAAWSESSADLMRVANAVKLGHTNRVPMGMIFVGPMGTGKTFVAEAFAAECGLTCLKFKNFRERWVGSTEGNLEKILDLVDALGYVLLILDEADRSLSSGDNDGGTSSRVIARLKEFMSDTSHRGRVVILMMTNRPDKLDTTSSARGAST